MDTMDTLCRKEKEGVSYLGNLTSLKQQCSKRRRKGCKETQLKKVFQKQTEKCRFVNFECLIKIIHYSLQKY